MKNCTFFSHITFFFVCIKEKFERKNQKIKSNQTKKQKTKKLTQQNSTNTNTKKMSKESISCVQKRKEGQITDFMKVGVMVKKKKAKK